MAISSRKDCLISSFRAGIKTEPCATEPNYWRTKEKEMCIYLYIYEEGLPRTLIDICKAEMETGDLFEEEALSEED
jgi:hypothetical protein